MKKMNNKGFAISTMLYGLLILIVLIIAMILSTMAFNRKNSREFSEKVVDDLEKRKNYYYTNQNIVIAYKYDSSTCVTGEEDTCEQISLTNSDKDIPAGTIIKYKVNDTDIVTFHVMHDNDTTMTMQSQKNTIYHTKWISKEDYAKENTDGTSCSYDSCNDEGPITALLALEQATQSWTNVNDQNYTTMGTTTFYTGCSDEELLCTTNTYTLPTRTVKVRMITVQEAIDLGCAYKVQTCPKWMYNYLTCSRSYGGTVNDSVLDSVTGYDNYGYWTMNAVSDSSYPWGAHHILCSGAPARAVVFINPNTQKFSDGARAVVVINK